MRGFSFCHRKENESTPWNARSTICFKTSIHVVNVYAKFGLIAQPKIKTQR